MGGLVPNASTFGPSIDSLFMLVLVITSVAFVVVEGLLIYFLIRYRHREGTKAYYTHGNRRLEFAWTLVPGLMLFGLALYQYRTWLNVKQNFPDESQALVVGIAANQFEWEATYPGEDGVLCTPDDVFPPVKIMHFPVNQPVIVRLKSEDVLHSFFVPELRVKQDAVPGLKGNGLWFEATQTGVYQVACAELCGLGHYRMQADVTIETQGEFDGWLAQQTSEESEHDYCQVLPPSS